MPLSVNLNLCTFKLTLNVMAGAQCHIARQFSKPEIHCAVAGVFAEVHCYIFYVYPLNEPHYHYSLFSQYFPWLQYCFSVPRLNLSVTDTCGRIQFFSFVCSLFYWKFFSLYSRHWKRQLSFKLFFANPYSFSVPALVFIWHLTDEQQHRHVPVCVACSCLPV